MQRANPCQQVEQPRVKSLSRGVGGSFQSGANPLFIAIQALGEHPAILNNRMGESSSSDCVILKAIAKADFFLFSIQQPFEVFKRLSGGSVELR